MNTGCIKINSGYINEVSIISSKSYVHRYLIMCALSNSEVTLRNITLSNDIIETINVLNCLGYNIKYSNDTISINNKTDDIINEKITINESGATYRMTKLLAINSLDKVTFNVGENLQARPQNCFDEIIASNNINFSNNYYSGNFTGNYFKIDGSISSQFISGLIFLCISLKNESKIEITNQIVSLNYLLMTIEVAKKFNVKINLTDNIITIDSRNLKPISNIYIEGDFSQATFFISHCVINKHDIVINNLNESSIQADKEIVNILQNNINFNFNNSSLICNYKSDSPISCNIGQCPDLGPILFVTAMFLNGTSTISGLTRLKYKESNRIESAVNILKKCNVKYTLQDDTIEIHGGKVNYDDIVIDSYNDHRIALSLMILSLYKPLTITNYQCIDKSYPTFIDVLKANKIKVQ